MRNLATFIDSLDSLPLRSPIRRPSRRPCGSYSSLAELDDIKLLDRLSSESYSPSFYFSK